MNVAILAALCGAIFVVALLIAVRWKMNSNASKKLEAELSAMLPRTQLVHKLCPHQNVLQSYPLDAKDSLDAHLAVLTQKLAEKEGRLRISKSKIRETQNEIQNLQPIDSDVRARYRKIMGQLKADILTNEMECKKLQDQIEWASQRRAELREEVRRGHALFGAAAEELTANLSELQRGRPTVVTEKPPVIYSNTSLRHRKEPLLPRPSPIDPGILKSQPSSPAPEFSFDLQNFTQPDHYI